MPSDFPHTERRKHNRYEISHLAIAVPKKNSAQVARIVNISMGGMAVRYLDQNDWLGNAESLDILVNSSFILTNLPIRNVSDFKVDNKISFSIISERQCCLEFGSLTREQVAKLDEFIVTYGGSAS